MHSISKKTVDTLGKPVAASQEISDTPATATFNLASALHLNGLAQFTNKLSGENTVTTRTLTHITVIVVAILAVSVSQLELPWGKISAVRPLKYNAGTSTTPQEAPQAASPALTLPNQLNDTEDDVLVRAAVPRTIIPDRTRAKQAREEITVYSVESGDTISGIAAKFGLSPETIIWANPDLENNPDLLWVGQELTILPVNGVYHQVGSSDTLEGIASTYKTEPQTIINSPLNELDPENPVIQPGQWLVIPGGQKPFVPRTVTAYSGPAPDDATVGTGIFGWPASGSITQGYFAFHPGLDIGGWKGAPILAADSGYVVATGWDDTGYGNMILIDHGNGFQTLYAHLDTILVEAGTNVAKGQQIAAMGSTGNSTGPHLHFELRQGTVQRNPYGFLP